MHICSDAHITPVRAIYAHRKFLFDRLLRSSYYSVRFLHGQIPYTDFGERMELVKREIEELSLLFEISQTLDRDMDLRDVVGPVLEAIAKNMGMLRGILYAAQPRIG